MKKIVLLLLCCCIAYPMEYNNKLVITSGACSVQGEKDNYEDSYDLDNKSSAVFDGHGTEKVAALAKSLFFSKFKEYMQDNTTEYSVKNGLFYALDACEEQMWKEPIAYPQPYDKNRWQDEALASHGGSTALASHIEQIDNPFCERTSYILHIIWLGDSRAIVGNNKSVIFATRDHKPTDPQETAYIEQWGGFVCSDERVCGDLATSRALGDIDLKKSFRQGPLNATPDYASIILTEDESFYLEVSDGFTDVIKNEEIPQLIKDSRTLSPQELKTKYPIRYTKWDHGPGGRSRKNLYRKINANQFCNSAKQIATRLVYIAMANRGSTDDVTVIVKLFNWKSSQ